MSGKRGWIWLIPIALVVTFVLAIGITWQQKTGVQTRLTSDSRSALAAVGLADGKISFDGRDASLSDFPADQIDRAAAVVRGVAGVRVVTIKKSPAKSDQDDRASTSNTPAATGNQPTGPSPSSPASSGPSLNNVKEALQLDINQQLMAAPITFEPNTAELTDEGEQAVQQLAKLLSAASQTTKFEVGGHVAKTTGPEAGALTLSRERARTVATLLSNSGIESKRITAKGYGDTQPNPEGDDRRVEITVR